MERIMSKEEVIAAGDSVGSGMDHSDGCTGSPLAIGAANTTYKEESKAEYKLESNKGNRSRRRAERSEEESRARRRAEWSGAQRRAEQSEEESKAERGGEQSGARERPE